MAIEVGWVSVGDPRVQIQSNHQCNLRWMKNKREGKKEEKCEEGSRWPAQRKGIPNERRPEGEGARQRGVPRGEGCLEAKGQEDKMIKERRKDDKGKKE